MERNEMEDLPLTETEQRYFGDLFVLCSDTENTGKVPLFKACELFRNSKVPPDIIKQITELCSGGKTSLGRTQFYTALKLIAASQAGWPVNQMELLHSVTDIPLPHFTWTEDDRQVPQDAADLIVLKDNNHRLNSSEGEVDDVLVKNRTSPKNNRLSPGASSTASDSPTPTNSVQEKSWAKTSHWQGIVCEEQRQLLGTEEESSDRHSSEEEADKELWTISSEQKEYYTTQFRSLQPDPTGLLAGSIARLFFEKSRLPVQELRKIWQLSDVTKDGALSLDEFNVAMHLVVLRRNNIPLPDTLPPCLVPPPVSDPPPSQPPLPPPPRDEASPGQSSVSSEPRGSKQWTKFVDSPTSSISSPGPKPVNFDFHKSAVEQDPKIYHPVPVRLTPEAPALAGTEEDTCRSPRRPEYESLPCDTGGASAQKKLLVSSMSQDGNPDIRPIQRPQPRKPPPGPGAIPPPPQQVLDDNSSGPTSLPVCVPPKKEPPPPPPPRPYATHARSSSLDLNRLGRSASLAAPPAVPPRISPSSTSPKKLVGQRSEGDVISLVGHGTAFADFAHFPGGEDEGIAEVDGVESAPRRHGAFQVYRKHAKRTECDSPPREARHHSVPDSLRKLEEHNHLLARMCYELSQELTEVREERALLQARLDHMQARYNT